MNARRKFMQIAISRYAQQLRALQQHVESSRNLVSLFLSLGKFHDLIINWMFRIRSYCIIFPLQRSIGSLEFRKAFTLGKFVSALKSDSDKWVLSKMQHVPGQSCERAFSSTFLSCADNISLANLHTLQCWLGRRGGKVHAIMGMPNTWRKVFIIK